MNNFSKKTVLIVEDNRSNYDYLYEYLERYPFVILHATDGLEAVETCKHNSTIDLIFMDIKMPNMDGYTAAGIIKKMRPKIKIVAQTAFALEDEIEQFRGNFDDYIIKPLTVTVLNHKLKKYLGSL